MMMEGMGWVPAVIFVVWLAVVVYVLFLATRLVNAVERIANKLAA